MSVLETVTVDNVTYDMHDPKVGSGTLQTTAQTLIPAVNELKTGVAKTDTIGSGTLDTTSQTLIGAINELKSTMDGGLPKVRIVEKTVTTSAEVAMVTFTTSRDSVLILSPLYDSGTDSGGSNTIKIRSDSTTDSSCIFGPIVVSRSNDSSFSQLTNPYGWQIGYQSSILFLKGGHTYTIYGKPITVSGSKTLRILYVLL